MTDEKPTPKPAPKAAPAVTENSVSPKRPTPPRSGTHVIGDGDTDPVHLSQAVYQNKKARKSMTVHHIQRRLWDWGFTDASSDPDGYYSTLTFNSVKAFQEKLGLEATGIIDRETFERLFEGDKNVTLVFNS